MKSQLFKSAWKLVKEMNITMSEALTAAWVAVKNEARVFVNTAWNGKKSIVFSKNRCQSSTIETLLKMVDASGSPDTSGAKYYYGVGAYNGD